MSNKSHLLEKDENLISNYRSSGSVTLFVNDVKIESEEYSSFEERKKIFSRFSSIDKNIGLSYILLKPKH